MFNRTNVSIGNTVTKRGAPWLLLAFIALLAGKYTIAPTLPWWLVWLPIYFIPAAILALLGAGAAGIILWFLLKLLVHALRWLKDAALRPCTGART